MEKPKTHQIPDAIMHFNTGDMYKKGLLLGKGFFAKCYLITNILQDTVHAAKIIPQSNAYYSNCVTNEVSLHEKLNHKNVVQFHKFFEDSHFGYILMEVCHKGCMQEMIKTRGFLTEPEVRYYMKQILTGIEYIHRQLIIHRDLKLGNLLLTNDLQVKISDFGTAIQSSKGLMHHGICGTPNYIAPEVVIDTGHSFEFDIFSSGCILYTLLLGVPPFQDTSRDRVFKRVRLCEYYFPTEKPSQEAKDLIQSMLQFHPEDRPTVLSSLSSPFMQGFVPAKLPLSSLTEEPLLEEIQLEGKSEYCLRKPLQELNREIPLTSPADKPTRQSSRNLKVGSPRYDNIQHERSEVAEGCQESAKPHSSKEVGCYNISCDPCNTSEKSWTSTAEQDANRRDIPSGHNCKEVEITVEEFQSVANNDSSWLVTETLDHESKLMDNICGIPILNGIQINNHLNMSTCDQKLVKDNCIESSTVTENEHKIVTFNGKSPESPHSSRCEQTETEQDTDKSDGLRTASNKAASHERRMVDTRMHIEVMEKSQPQNVIASADVNTRSGVEGTDINVVETKGKATSCHMSPKHGFDSSKKSEASNLLVTSSYINQKSDTSEEYAKSNSSSIGDSRRYFAHQIEELSLSIYTHLQLILHTCPVKRMSHEFQADIHGNATPIVVRVLRWYDYTTKYGFGYQLSNGSVGVRFNDSTNMVLLLDGEDFFFVTGTGHVSWHKMGNCSDDIDKKVRVLLAFKNSFQELQEKAGQTITAKDGKGRTPYMITQYNDLATTIMLLSNEALQIDILKQNTKIIFCPGLTNIIFINADKQSHTLRFKSVLENGCSPELAKSFEYAFNGVIKMISMNDESCNRKQILSTLKRNLQEEMGSLKKLKTTVISTSEI